MDLFNVENKGKEDLIIEQYKLYVEMADKVSDRRSGANNFFLTVNTVVLTLIGINGFKIGDYGWVVSIVGLIISYTWFYTLKSYKQLNDGKFKTIHKIETALPLNLYSYEWDILQAGKNRASYWPASNIESIIPVLFGLVYFVFGIAVII